MKVRVVAQHALNLFAILGIFEEEECLPVVELGTKEYFLAERHTHWYLYKPSIESSGKTGQTPDMRQV